MKNKNEGCQQLNDPLQGSGCSYNNGVVKIKTHDKLEQFGLQPAWDIEDLVTLGKKIRACPYFAARSLKETADIVFCPYNYLIDPFIRDAMSINLKDQIIVLDEAHNIEDSARESTSCKITEDDLCDALKDLRKLMELKFCEYECNILVDMLTTLSTWIDSNKENLTDYKEFDRCGKIFSGTEMVANLDNLNIGREKYDTFKECLSTLTADQDPDENNPRLSTPTSSLIKAILLMFHFLFLDEMKYKDDYRIAIVKSQVRSQPNKRRNSNEYFSKKGSLGWEYSLNFWCLNPAVAFLSFGAAARSIVLTSGTLSPMSSFQSELSVPFQIQLEANHVIDKSQVWVGTIARGPRNHTLQATYRNTETWEFQDELGQLMLSICRVIPHGVLCFLPSYSMLNKMVDRWHTTGLWNEIQSIKVAITEPRKGEEFEAAMSLFYDTVRETRDEGAGDGITGALFIAVCRGKVSEGLDFTDDNARAVIAVGIPFPSIKDIQVDLKRQYNNHHFRDRGLLSGSEWYEIQAYRALNQALGRCIRHRYDWGALILVDERYQQRNLSGGTQLNKYTRNLSKWVRNNVVHHPNFAAALSNLQQFAENMKANPPTRPESLEESTIVGQETIDSKLTSQDRIFKDGVAQSGTSETGFSSSTKAASLRTEMLNTSIVGGLTSSDNDPDFSSLDETLIIPSSRFVASTQISTSKEETVNPPVLSQITAAESNHWSTSGFVTSTQISASKEKTVNPPVLSQITAAESNCLNTMSKESSKLSDLALGLKKNLFSPSDAVSSVRAQSTPKRGISGKSQPSINLYFSKPDSIVNQLKTLSPNATPPSRKRKPRNRKPRVRKARKRKSFSAQRDFATSVAADSSLDSFGDGQEKKDDQKSEICNEVSQALDDDSQRNTVKSPQLFESDDDLFSDCSRSDSPVMSCREHLEEKKDNVVDTVGNNGASTSKVRSSIGSSTMNGNSTSPLLARKDGSPISGDKSKNNSKEVEGNLLSNTSTSIVFDDSDMEDFCLEKSYTAPKAKKIRRASKHKTILDDQDL